MCKGRHLHSPPRCPYRQDHLEYCSLNAKEETLNIETFIPKFRLTE
jgi:hypothetical protein